MEIYPTEIKRISKDPQIQTNSDFEGLSIKWSDGKTTLLSSEVLRKNCPCASCNEKRGDKSHDSPLTAKKGLLKIVEHSKETEIELKKIWQIGQYAIGILWGDGHQAGIYSFTLLRDLSEVTG